MTADLKRTFTPARLRCIVYMLVSVAAVVAVLGAISSSRAIGQHGDGLVFPENVSVSRVDTPSPLPCFPCWFLETIIEDFDNVSPPALPTGWIATNA